jgi:hypothetical protein
MNDLETLKSELAVNGISVESDGTCQVHDPNAEMPVSMKCEDKIAQLSESIRLTKREFKNMWVSFTETLARCDGATVGGAATTEKMYVAALKRAYRLANSYHYFAPQRRLLNLRLNQDIKRCPENIMSRAVDYHICLDWLFRGIKNDSYRMYLLKEWIKKIRMLRNTVAQQMTPAGALDLPMKERVWSFSEDEEDFKNSDAEKRHQQRYQLPETYNDPDKFEEGFYWREIRNEPYSFWDEENDPYPHYYNYKSKVHRGME